MIGLFGPRSFTYPNGNPAANELVSVLDVNGNPAELWADQDATIAFTNPIATDSMGNAYFYIEEGSYELVVRQVSIDINVDAGIPGPKGDKGDQGDAGPPGLDGVDGSDGAPGVPGDPGSDGADGAPGLDGAPGADGADGAPGQDGAPGAKGDQGDPGAPGADGADGVDLTLPTKRATLSLGAPRSSSGAGALVDWGERIPITLPVKTTRWRLRVGNRWLNPTGPAEIRTQQFTLSDIVLGEITGITAQGRPLASYTVPPVKVLDGGMNPADGTDWVSAWVVDPAMQFGPGDVKTIGMTISGVNNGNGSAVTGAHNGFRRSTAGAAGSLFSLSSAGYLGNTLALDKRIEYEWEGNESVALIIGPSGDEGYNTTAALDGLGGYEIVQTHETWPGVFGMAKKVCVINAGITGATQAPFLDPASLAYTRFDLATTVPDVAIVSMGGNAIVTYGGTAAASENETLTVVQAIRALGIKKIYLTTISPAGLAAGDAKEVQRKAYNDWVRNLPLGVTGILDFDDNMRDPVDNLKQVAGFVSADNVHPSLAGYSKWGHKVSVR